jgi:subtilisin family serine protease
MAFDFLPENLIIPPPELPVQFDSQQLLVEDIEVDTLIRVQRAHDTFKVNGTGLTVAVLDTGLRTTHVDFAGRVRAQRNFTADNGGAPGDASDGAGHGTNVGGIIVGNGIHVGIAPGAGIVPLKVLGNSGGGSFEAINAGLQWVLDNHEAFNITVVNLSLGAELNLVDDAETRDFSTTKLISQLTERNIAVVVAAGNEYFQFKQPGMGFPAIVRETVSVGAVYDSNVGPFQYESGAEAFSTGANRITPFSQRLHDDHNQVTRTDIFAPGAPVTAAGINNDKAESVQQGTSQATPVTSGVILLMQEFFLRSANRLPSVETIIECLRKGAVETNDGDDEDDNVPHTGKNYLRIDAFSALVAARRSLQLELLKTGVALR